MHVRGALRALFFAMTLPLAVAGAGETPAAHGTEIDDGACGDQPCEQTAPEEGSPCGDRPCEETAPEGGACGDRPCEETAPEEGNPCGDRPCEETAPEGGACGDRPCEETAPEEGSPCGDRPCEGLDPAAGAPTMDDAPEPGAVDSNTDEAGDLDAASSDRGSFPTTPVVVGLAAVLLIALASVMAKRWRR